jgi:DNA-binding PadR family transcriptional regulator
VFDAEQIVKWRRRNLRRWVLVRNAGCGGTVCTCSQGPAILYYSLRYYSLRTMVTGMGERDKGRGLRRANDPPLLILTSLAEGPKHGYALAQDIGEFAGVQLSPGALYGAITRLEERGLIEALPEVERRRPYRITVAGSAELTQAMRDMRRVVDAGTYRLGLMRGRLA